MNINEKITVLVVEPGKKPYAKEISSELSSLQHEVGGYIQAVYPYEDPVAIICNEEGKLIGLPLNRALRGEDGQIYDVIAGTFLIVGLGEEDFTSLTPQYMKQFKEKFDTPETFVRSNGKLVVLPEQPLSESEAKRQALLNSVKELGEKWERSPEDMAEYLAFSSRFYKYSPRNLQLIYCQNPNASFVASMSEWNKGLPDKDGNPLSEEKIYIKKGEKALNILAPTEREYYRAKGSGEWKMFSGLSVEEKRSLKSEPERWEKQSRIGFIFVPVFDIGQVNCPKELLPKVIGIGASDLNARQLFDAVKYYAESELKATVVVEDLNSVALRGTYNRETNVIKVNDVLEDTQRLSTLIHEVGHAEIHRVAGDKSTPQKELEADMYALMVESLCGIESTDARKAHLADHYKEFVSEQAKLPAESRVTVDNVFDTVFARYQASKPQLEATISKVRELPKQTAQVELKGLEKKETFKISKI